MIHYKGINHLAMATCDMDRTVRFWRDLLGMRLVAGLGHPGYRHYFFEISANDLLAFFEWPDVEPLPEKDHGRPARGPLVFDHVSFGVATEEDLWAIKDKLTAADVWVSEVIDHGFIHSIYAFDPNGIAIEFSYDLKGEELRSRPRMVDQAPSAVTREGAEPQWGQWPAVEHPTSRAERKVHPGAGSELFHGRKDD